MAEEVTIQKGVSRAQFFKKESEAEEKRRTVIFKNTDSGEIRVGRRSDPKDIKSITTYKIIENSSAKAPAKTEETSLPTKEEFKAGATISEYKKPTGRNRFENTLINLRSKQTKYSYQAERESYDGKQIKGYSSDAKAFGYGVASGLVGLGNVFVHPVNTVKGLYSFGKEVVKNPFKVGAQFKNTIDTNFFGLAGEFAGMRLGSKVVGSAGKSITKKVFNQKPVSIKGGFVTQSKKAPNGLVLEKVEPINYNVKIGKNIYKVTGSGRGVITPSKNGVSNSVGAYKLNINNKPVNVITKGTSKASNNNIMSSIKSFKVNGKTLKPKSSSGLISNTKPITNGVKISYDVGKTNLKGKVNYAGAQIDKTVLETPKASLTISKGKGLIDSSIPKNYMSSIFSNLKPPKIKPVTIGGSSGGMKTSTVQKAVTQNSLSKITQKVILDATKQIALSNDISKVESITNVVKPLSIKSLLISPQSKLNTGLKIKTESITNLKPISIFKISAKRETILKQNSKTKLIIEPISKTAQKNKTISISIFKQSSKETQIVRTRLTPINIMRESSDTSLKKRVITVSPLFNQTSRGRGAPIMKLFISPPVMSFDHSRNQKSLSPINTKFISPLNQNYAPTLDAVLFNIKGSKRPKFITGLKTRGIL